MISIKGKKDYLVALESVAMTDIVLNMFIFFFISFSLLYTFNSGRLSKIEVNLPKASSAVSLEGSEKTVLAITKAGEYFINEEKVKGADLKQNLRSRLEENPS
ncbi:MAG: biopolymer transporter ExbD, partial [Candidatus Omnitrophica bacterium]|nr:biopolymer transporter ExbD [Candidatus Omnitrophota bacterium]